MHFQNLGSTQLKHKYLENKRCYRQMEYKFLICKGSLIHSKFGDLAEIMWCFISHSPFTNTVTFFTASIFTRRLLNTIGGSYILYYH